MSISLSQLSRPGARALALTICGEGGVGKTSLASLLPKPVFIRAEDGLTPDMDVQAFPIARTIYDVFESLKALYVEPHDFGTAVMDSVTQLNIMIENQVMREDRNNPSSINQACGGYGAGHAAVSEKHRQVRAMCDKLMRDRNMHVVFLAHANTEKVEPPDQDPYTRYSIRMNPRSISHYSDNVDLVGFLKLETYVTGDGERKQASTTGNRILTAYPTPNHISKNRLGITSDLIFEPGVNPLAPYLPDLSALRSPAPAQDEDHPQPEITTEE